jgi:hypothetical protein
LALVLTLAGSLAACETPPGVSSAQSTPPVNADAVQTQGRCSSQNVGFDVELNHFPLTAWPEDSFVDPCWPH